MAKDHYDLVVIGAGSGGLVAARFAAQLRATVALAERNRIGGDCTWTGCVPRKAFMKAAKITHEGRNGSCYGVISSVPAVDMVQVREYVRSAIQAVYRFETPEQLQGEGIDVILGNAQFIDAATVKIGDRVVRSKKFLLTTGARPLVPPIAGLDEVPYVTYENIFDNEVLPKTIIVVGGGPHGMELAQAHQGLGSQVTDVADPTLLKEDAGRQQLVRKLFESRGERCALEQAQPAGEEGGG